MGDLILALVKLACMAFVTVAAAWLVYDINKKPKMSGGLPRNPLPAPSTALASRPPVTAPHPTPARLNPGDNANCTQCGASFFSAGAWNVRCLGCIKLGQPVTSRTVYPGQAVQISSGASLPVVLPGSTVRHSFGYSNPRAMYGPSSANVIALLTPSARAHGFDISCDPTTDDIVLEFQGAEVGRILRSDIVSGAYKHTFGAVCQRAQAVAQQIQQSQLAMQAQIAQMQSAHHQINAALMNVYQQGAPQAAAAQIVYGLGGLLGALGTPPYRRIAQGQGGVMGCSAGLGGALGTPLTALFQGHSGALISAAAPIGGNSQQRITSSAKLSLATSDQLETFIHYLEGEGIPEKVARKVSLNVFIIWTVAEAEKAEEGAGRATERLATEVARLKSEYPDTTTVA